MLEDVLVDGLAREGDLPLFLSAVVFRHVTLRGKVSLFKLAPAPGAVPDPRAETAWIAAHRQFYAGVDWALNIREARFSFGPDLHFVPGHLVRRDEETQALVRRQAFDGVDPGRLPWKGSAMEIALEWFLEDGPWDSAVLVAGRQSKSFRKDLAALEMLRREGLAT